MGTEDDNDNSDMDMGNVQEDTDKRVIGIVHEDIEDTVSSTLLNQMGQSGRSYRREFAQGHRHLVSEIYPPPRVTDEVRQGRYRNLAPGFALDLTVIDQDDGQPWDLPTGQTRES